MNEDIEALNQWLLHAEPLDPEIQIRNFQIAIDVRNNMRTFEDARKIWFEKYPEPLANSTKQPSQYLLSSIF